MKSLEGKRLRSDKIIHQPKPVHRIPKQTLIRAGENNPNIYGMRDNSARDELFLADNGNKVVRAIRVSDNAGDVRDVYRAPLDKSSLISVSHMSDSDTLLVCSGEYGPDQKLAYWLVALIRNGSEWREAQRVQTDGMGTMCCALSDSRVLIGERSSTNMELFRVERRPVHCARPPHPRARRVLLVLRDARQRHARGDVLPVYGPVGARASTARRPVGGTRVHSVEVAQSSPVAR